MGKQNTRTQGNRAQTTRRSAAWREARSNAARAPAGGEGEPTGYEGATEKINGQPKRSCVITQTTRVTARIVPVTTAKVREQRRTL